MTTCVTTATFFRPPAGNHPVESTWARTGSLVTMSSQPVSSSPSLQWLAVSTTVGEMRVPVQYWYAFDPSGVRYSRATTEGWAVPSKSARSVMADVGAAVISSATPTDPITTDNLVRRLRT